MSHTREMLDTTPRPVTLDVEALAAAIDACLDAVQACTSCADSSLVEEDIAELSTCIALDIGCADLCAVTARFLSRPARADHVVTHQLLGACVRTCASCAEECERHAAHHRHCAVCAKVCRVCERACAELLEADAFEELQKLAGG